MATQKSKNVQVKLKNVRIAFMQNLFEPGTLAGKSDDGDGGEPAYSCNFLLDKTSDDGKANIDAMKRAIMEVWKDKWPEVKDGKPVVNIKADKRCMRDGDEESYDGFPGNMYVSARAPKSRAPVVVDRNRAQLTEKSGRPYAGCYVNAVVTVWAQDNNFGKRINASLNAVQFVRDGEAFGTPQVDPNDVFDDLSGGADGATASSSDFDSFDFE